MVAATKNKRGRPQTIARQTAESAKSLYNNTIRTVTNKIHFADGMKLLTDTNRYNYKGTFFWTIDGKDRNNGIAEQIGRMLNSGYFTEKECKELGLELMDRHAAGEKIKDIEKTMRLLRGRMISERKALMKKLGITDKEEFLKLLEEYKDTEKAQ